jgi:hypothetical protein
MRLEPKVSIVNAIEGIQRILKAAQKFGRGHAILPFIGIALGLKFLNGDGLAEPNFRNHSRTYYPVVLAIEPVPRSGLNRRTNTKVSALRLILTGG